MKKIVAMPCKAILIDRAIESLARSLALGAEEFLNYAKTDTDLDAIRSDDRFQELVDGVR
jgi:hypothetical protein